MTFSAQGSSSSKRKVSKNESASVLDFPALLQHFKDVQKRHVVEKRENRAMTNLRQGVDIVEMIEKATSEIGLDK